MSWGLGKGRRHGGEGSRLRGREENGNPELIPGISLIVSIPPHEYLELYSPKLFWLPPNSFPLFQSFPEMGFGASESQIPDPSEPGVRKALDTGNFRLTHFSPSAEIKSVRTGCVYSVKSRNLKPLVLIRTARSVVIGAPQPRIWSHLGFQMPASWFPQSVCHSRGLLQT